MWPVLLKTPVFTIYTYGFFVTVAFICSLELVLYRARKEGIQDTIIYDLTLLILVFGILGARLLEIIINLPFYSSKPLEIFKVWKGGLSFYGGFIGAAIAAVIFSIRKKLNLWQMADLYAPGISLGHTIGRLGCFFAGCCHGKVTSLPWGIIFRNPYSLAPLGVRLYPTQLISSLANFLIFFYLLQVDRKKAYNGQTFVYYIICYAIFRFFIEFLRGDERGAVIGFFSLFQIIALLMVVVGVIVQYKLEKSKRYEKNKI